MNTYFYHAVELCNVYPACSEQTQVSWHRLTVMILKPSQMDPTQRLTGRNPIIQHHLTYNRRKPRGLPLSCSPRSGMPTRVARPHSICVSSCLSACPLRWTLWINLYPLLWWSIQTCQRNPPPFIHASAAMWHPVHPDVLRTLWERFRNRSVVVSTRTVKGPDFPLSATLCNVHRL